jgi:hypothetical protein
MKKILKLENQPIETYQGISFMQSIILAHNNIKNEIYNSYINLVCNNSNNINDIKLNFLDVTWEDFRLRNLVHMYIYILSNIIKDNISSFLKERIDHNDYILIFNIDEFYLSYSKAYQKNHYIHDTYIFGYDNDEFAVMAYKNSNLQRIWVNQNEIKTGIHKAWIKDKDIGICTLQVYEYVNQEIDISKIINNLNYYLNSKDNNGNSFNDNTYGISIYKKLDEYIFNKKGETSVDLRLFRMFWEHKKMMRLRIEKINEIFCLDNERLFEIKEIENMANIIFNMMIKYSLKCDIDIMQRTLFMLSKIEQKEKSFIENIIKDLTIFRDYSNREMGSLEH